MSHFCVLVIGGNIDEQLAPFAEQEADEQYLVFNNMEPETRKEYKTKKRDMILLRGSKEPVSPYEDKFKNPEYSRTFRGEQYIYPAGSKKIQVAFSKVYKTYEEFMKDWHGYEKKDEKKKKYGYWHNPNAKWDWYETGGRWTGYFKLKANAKGKVGRPGVMTEPAKEGYADSVKLKDVDFEGMMKEGGEDYGKSWDRMARLMGGTIPKLEKTWKEILDGKETKKFTIDKKREMYHSQAPLKQIDKLKADVNTAKEDRDFLVWLEYENYMVDRKDYVKKGELANVVSFAFVKDSKWHEKGDMGWWGIVSNEKNPNEWQEEFFKMLKSLPPETELTLVDCHI